MILYKPREIKEWNEKKKKIKEVLREGLPEIKY